MLAYRSNHWSIERHNHFSLRDSVLPYYSCQSLSKLDIEILRGIFQLYVLVVSSIEHCMIWHDSNLESTLVVYKLIRSHPQRLLVCTHMPSDYQWRMYRK